MEQQIIWDEKENTVSLVTKNKDGSIIVQPLTVEEAAQWQAQNKY